MDTYQTNNHDELCAESTCDYIQPCVYCGMPGDSIDHIPPRYMREQLRTVGLLAVYEREVPACRECNSTLGSRPLLTITERREYIREHLRRKYRAYLKMKNFTDEELQEFGESLRGMLRRNLRMKDLILQRIRWPQL